VKLRVDSLSGEWHGHLIDPLAAFLADLYRGGHRVLVHCSMELNRSPLVAGVVLHRLGWNGCAAVERLRQRRPGALFNEHYSGYLERLPAAPLE
jgi:protein-tyrosine phosphatase